MDSRLGMTRQLAQDFDQRQPQHIHRDLKELIPLLFLHLRPSKRYRFAQERRSLINLVVQLVHLLDDIRNGERIRLGQKDLRTNELLATNARKTLRILKLRPNNVQLGFL